MSAGAAELWLRALQRLTAAVAHELRNPLNGVALNLEVLRGRVGRHQHEPATLTAFAEAAVTDLGAAVRLTDALLAVARPVRLPVEAGTVLAPIATLVSAVAASKGGALRIEIPDEIAPALDVNGNAIRAALATALLDAAEKGATIDCRVVYEPATVSVEVTADREFDFGGDTAAIESFGVAVQTISGGVGLRMARDGATR